MGQRGQARGTEPAGTELGLYRDREALLSGKLLLTSSPLRGHHHCPLAVLLGDLKRGESLPADPPLTRRKTTFWGSATSVGCIGATMDFVD